MDIKEVLLQATTKNIILDISFEKDIYQECTQSRISTDEFNRKVDIINEMTKTLLNQFGSFMGEYPKECEKGIKMDYRTLNKYVPS